MCTFRKTILSLIVLASITQNTTAFSFKETVSNLWSKVGWAKQEENTIQISKKVPPKTSITVANTKGRISIKTWDRNEILVEAHLKGPEGSLELTDVSATLKGDMFAIATKIKDQEAKLAGKCKVRYDIIIPRTAQLKSVTTEEGRITIAGVTTPLVARSQNGNIDLENISGGAKVQTKYGNITIHANDINQKQTILAVSEYGNIHLKLPKTMKNANVLARTNKGRVSSEFPITSTRTMKMNKQTVAQLAREIHGTIGEGGTNIKLQTGKGNIKLVTT